VRLLTRNQLRKEASADIKRLLEAQHYQGENVIAPPDPIAIKLAVYAARRYSDVTSLTLEDDRDRL